jgi:23S rRNA (cytosine1962-C5)-methyltransferase
MLSPHQWTDYELIDCGDFEKLERFGKVVLIRSEPQANWPKALTQADWNKYCDIHFKSKSTTRGEWLKKNKNAPDAWDISYKNKDIDIRLHLKLTAFKHVGVFPEQAVNWDYISSTLRSFKTKKPKVLNLFAYTGGASLVAKAAGADITHVDSIKQVVTWANSNQELSGLKDIRWVVEDALKFVKREIKRGNQYNGIILDPPAYGHGPKGERWKLENHLTEMVQDVIKLLDPKEHFLILNTYSDGISPSDIHSLISTSFPQAKNLETGELYLRSLTNKKLMLGSFGRFRKQ